MMQSQLMFILGCEVDSKRCSPPAHSPAAEDVWKSEG